MRSSGGARAVEAVPDGAFRRDFRLALLVCASVPLLLWIGGLGLLFSPLPAKGLLATGLVVVGMVLARLSPRIAYWVAESSCRLELKGTAAVDYLLFELEDPETYSRMKLIPDGAGFLWVEDGRFQIATLTGSYAVPFADLTLSEAATGGSGLGMSFRPRGATEPIAAVATFKYVGAEREIITDPAKRRAWARRTIERLRSSA